MATSTVTVPASFRSAMRKTGTLALRPRRTLSSSVACTWVCSSLSPRVQFDEHAVDRRIGRHGCLAILEGECFEHLDTAGAEFFG